MLKAFEVLELYLELLAVRAELLAKTKEIPSDMVEVCAGWGSLGICACAGPGAVMCGCWAAGSMPHFLC